jgi:hypothetical protein
MLSDGLTSNRAELHVGTGRAAQEAPVCAVHSAPPDLPTANSVPEFGRYSPARGAEGKAGMPMEGKRPDAGWSRRCRTGPVGRELLTRLTACTCVICARGKDKPDAGRARKTGWPGTTGRRGGVGCLGV